ncbi:amino acid adenylation domain-containing protein [Paenibacillus sophorae]|uniref:amino acid adenylation domain-containing protein n=1 Tax=Paenibacillus sophorae TaxID=1333845 RepID=UPI000B82E8D7|nr:non-ribosomal peptide synthetase [Paenibacillus sophorae]
MNDQVLVSTPLSYGQKALWFQHQGNQEAPFNHLSFAARVVSGKDPDRLRQALNRLFQKYDSLHTRFFEREGELFQEVVHEVELPFEEIDATSLDEPTLLAKIAEVADEPYDLTSGVLMKAKLYHCANGEMVFFLGFHHISVDLWSMTGFIQELSQIFGNEAIGEEKREDRVNNYAEFVEYQSLIVHGDRGEELLNYWQSVLGQEIPILQLPEDATRPGIKTHRAATIRFELPMTLEASLRAFAKERGVTLYPVLLAAYMALLHKYSGQSDIVVGSPYAGRTRGKFRETFGFFVNMLVNRQLVTPKMSFVDLVTDVNQSAGKHLRKQDFPFPALVQKVTSQRDRSRSPLYDVEFVYDRPRMIEDIAPFIQGWNGAQLDLGELVFESIEFEKRWLERDLQLFISEGRDKLYGTLTYNRDLFFTTTAERFVSHFINLLTSAIREPENAIGSLDYLCQEERFLLLKQWNQTERAYPETGWVHDWLRTQAQETPQQTALHFSGKKLTYQELDDRIDRIAGILAARGVQTESPVAIVMYRSVEMVASLHAVMRTGGFYVPIDPELPQERIEWMVTEVNPNVILTQKSLLPLLEKLGVANKAIVLDDGDLPEAPAAAVPLAADNAAYMIYTSGSTSRPKGVVNTHGGIRNRILWMQEALQLSSKDRVLQKTPYSFDVSVWEFLWPFLVGAQLVVAKPEGHKDPDYLIDLIKEESITTIHFVPSMLQIFLANPRSRECASLRRVICSGEALPVTLAKEFFEAFPDCELHNLYGPTEAAVDVTWWKCEPSDSLRSVPIGYPIANTQMYILDEMLNPVPIGVTGDLYIGGCQLARGYWKRPDLTADRFIPDLFAEELGHRIYKTGDIARYLENGAIEYLGRSDFQVKIRGFRIELGEIEAQLQNHDSIKEAVVADRGEAGNKYLCAYIVADWELTVTELRDYLSKQLPGYMIPSFFVYLDQLPLSPNGKLDRKALPEPDKSVYTGVEYAAPTHEIEAKLVKIFQEVLEVEDIGIHHDFFELGGHSLKATILISKIHKELHVEVPLSEVFANPKIKELAHFVQNTEQNTHAAIQPIAEQAYYPTSSAQKRLYILGQLEGAGASYNMPGAMLVEGDLDKDRLEEAFRQLIQRHETLRTSFEMADEEIVQRVRPNVLFTIDVKEAVEEQAEAFITEFVQPFDLSQAPLLRVELIKLATDRHLLLFDMHHIISDGVSIGILIQEFVTLYQGNYLSPLRIQYKDFSAWQNERFASPALQADERYWLDTFAGEIPVLNMPTDFPRPSVQNFEGSSLTFELGRELTGKLHALAKATGSTLYMVLLAAYNTVLSKYTGQEDIVIGSPIAGRPHADLQSMIGMFVNTLAMRNFPVSELTFREFLKRVKENALKAYEHQNYPFEQLVEQLNIPRDMSRNPLFDTLFVLQNTDRGQLEVEGLSFTPYPFDSGMAKFDLTITVEEVEGRLACTLGYCTKLFKKETVERLAGHFTNILQQVADNAETKLAQLDMLSADERRQILEDFNNTAVSTQNCKTVIEQFEEQVEKTPDRPALLFENDVLTYREFNRQANQVAHYLRQKGVGENTVVGLMTQRSLEMMVGLYGILKAGAAYVPIDAEYPQERIRYLLDDSQITLVLTQRQLNVEVTHEGSEFTAIEDLLEQNEWSGDNLGLTYDPARIMYLLYTSGSTGKPKGVKVRANAFANLIDWFTSDQYEITDQDNILLIAPISFDLAQKNLYASLVKGGTLCLFTPGLYDYNRMFRIIKQQNITFVNCTPSAFQPLVDFDTKFESLKTLRCVYLGGEPLKPAFLTPWIRSGACNARIINSYGPAECTDVATSYQIDGREFEHLATVPVGKPIRNAKVYVLDKNRQPVPLGTLGEFYIGGVGVSAGYFNRPELTADRFVSVKVDGQEPQLLYRTGDVGKWLPDGNLEFLGRVDHQVKIRGFRIELSEIETQMLQHDNIKEAIVSAKGNEDDLYLCAYVVADRELPGAELKAYLSEYLPDYMVPPYYVQMDKLPLTPNGKVDRNALPEPDKAAQASVKYVAPTNEIEAKLLDIFQQVLNVQGIGTHHDFFELGGHSLLVMRLVLRIQETFNVGISVRDVFSHSLTESLSRLIGSKVQTSDLSPGLLPIQKTDPDTVIFPLSYAQQRLWFLDQLNPGSSNYNMVGAYKLTGEINSARLEAVFNEIARRHAILRTTFGVREGVPYQHVNAEPRIGFHCIEIPAEQEVSTLIQEEARVGFDLTHGPLLRVLLMRKEGHQSEHVLVVNMHHIISDGWSLNVLVREIGELWKLSGEPEGDFSQFQQPVLQYGDYSIWQRDLFETGYLNEQMVYWKQHLGGHKGVLELPTDKTRSTSGVGRGAEVPIRIAESELTMLKQLAQANSCTLYMVLLAAYAVVIQRYSGEDDIVIGTAVANRSRSELEGLIGFFVNTLALRIDLSEELQLSEYLERVKKVVLNGFSNGDVPFDVVLDEVNPPRLPGIHPLFQTMFILQTASPTTISLQGLEITPVHMPLDESKFDLFLNLEEVRGELVGHLEFNEDLFHGEQIRKLGEYLTSLLDAWVKNADGKLSELKASIQAGRQAKPVLSPQDLRGLLNKLTDGRSG